MEKAIELSKESQSKVDTIDSKSSQFRKKSRPTKTG